MYLSYDIELYNELSEDKRSLKGIIPSVAATCTSENDLKYWYDIPFMTSETAKSLVNFMMDNLKNDIIPFTWNGTAFDFPLLAEYSGMTEECAELALNGVDGMLLISFNKGYFLGLDTALKGAGVSTKVHEVTLKDGTILAEMSGSIAPKLWRDGEYEAVKTYLAGDVFRPLELIVAIEKRGGIAWTSKTGRPMFQITKLVPVKDLFGLPMPNCSWMAVPVKPRIDYVNWIPKEILDKYKISA